MIHTFLVWWLTQLRDLVLKPAAAADAVVATVSAEEVTLRLRRKGRESPIASFPLDAAGKAAARRAVSRRMPTMLRLGPDALLEREFVLPLAAERDPARVLGYEMDRATPFTVGEVFWTWTLLRRDRAHGRLHVLISLVPKAAASGALAVLTGMGLSPAAIEVDTSAGETRWIGLGPTGSGAGRAARLALTTLTASWAVLAVAMVALPFASQWRDSQRVEARIAALRPRVAEAEELRHRIAAREAGVDALAAARARLGDAVEALAALTEVLPDDTFVTELALRQGKLTLAGQSAAATRLIAAVSTATALRNPSFAAPVTRLDGGRGDQFSIQADLAPP